MWRRLFNRITESSALLKLLSNDQRVTPKNAMEVSSLGGCIKVLSESIASLPVRVLLQENRSKTPATSNPLFRLLTYAPNELQSPYEYIETLTGHVALRGNHYSYINRLSDGRIGELLPLHPDSVDPVEDSRGTIIDHYDVMDGDGRVQSIPRRDMLHVKAFSMDGKVGISPLSAYALTIESAHLATSHERNIFRNSAQPSSLLLLPKGTSKPKREEFKEQWHEQYGGDNKFKTAILTGQVEWKQLGLSNADAQLLELRRFHVEEIARIFRVPLVMLQHEGKTSAYASAEQFFLSFLRYTLMPWMRRIEQSMETQLLPFNKRGRVIVRFNPEALLRGTSKERAAFYRMAIMDGWMTRNEVREKEDMTPGPTELDEFLQPSNLTSVEDLGDGDDDSVPGSQSNVTRLPV